MKIRSFSNTSSSMLIVALLIYSLMLSGCVQTPPVKPGDYALLISNYPIIQINGEAIDSEGGERYKQDIKVGENTVLIVYNTYKYDYYCSFSWQAESGQVYEVTDQENAEPLTLYRWKRKNRLWSQRLDPVDPTHCERKPRPQTESDPNPVAK